MSSSQVTMLLLSYNSYLIEMGSHSKEFCQTSYKTDHGRQAHIYYLKDEILPAHKCCHQRASLLASQSHAFSLGVVITMNSNPPDSIILFN